MTKRYGIGIILFAGLICLLYWADYRALERKSEIQTETEVVSELPATQVSGRSDPRVYNYYLFDEKGYVSVYLDDRITLYETTSILVRQLPESIQAEIARGKPIEDEHELYNFLENYSS